MSTPERLMAAYESGDITPAELRLCLIQAAAHYPPDEIARLLSEEALGQIRALTQPPPESIQACPRIFGIVSYVGPVDAAERERRERQLWYDGAWAWHRYFSRSAPATP